MSRRKIGHYMSRREEDERDLYLYAAIELGWTGNEAARGASAAFPELGPPMTRHAARAQARRIRCADAQEHDP